MGWKDLSKSQQEFVKKYFTVGRKNFTRAEGRTANLAVIAGYEEFLRCSEFAAAQLEQVKGTSLHDDYANKFGVIKSVFQSKGMFLEGAAELRQLTTDLNAAKVADRLAQAKDPERTKVFNDQLGKLRAVRDKDRAEIDKLSKALSEGSTDPIDPETLPLIKEYETLFLKTTRALQVAQESKVDTATAIKVMSESVKVFVTERGTLMERIKACAKDPTKISESIEVLGDQKKYQTFETECYALALELRTWGHPKAAGLTKDLEGVHKDTSDTNAFDVGFSALTLWKQGADKERASYLSSFETELATHIAKLHVAKTIREGLEGVPKEQLVELDDLIEMAQLTIDEASDPSKGKNTRALRPLQGIIVSATNLARELGNAKTLNDSSKAKIKEIEGLLGPVDGSKPPEAAGILPKKYADIQGEFVELHKDWMSTMSPQEAQMAFIQFQSKAKAFDDAATAMKAWRKRMNDAVKEVKTAVRDLSKIVYDFQNEDNSWVSQKLRDIFGRTGIEFEGTATKDLEDIVTAINSEDATTHDFTEKKLVTLLTKLVNWHGSAEKLRDAMKSGEPVAAKDMDVVAKVMDDHKQAVAEREEHERQVKMFKEKCDLLDKAIDQSAKDDTNTEETNQELHDIKELNKAARAQADANLDAAREMSKRVDFRLRTVLAAAPKAQSNFDWLSKMPGYWGKAVEQLNADMARLKTNVTKAASGDGMESAKLNKLSADLDKFAAVAAKFKADAFNAPSAVMGDDKKTLEDRKRAREQALGQVRLYRGYLQSNPLIRHAIKNPFNVQGIAMAVNSSLNKIELEVLRGI